MMNWPDERYVRVYTRDTPEWLCLPWQARAVWPQVLRKVDRSGVLATKLGPRGVAVLIALPVDVTEVGLVGLLVDGCLREHSLGYVIPNFVEAQEAAQSGLLRQRASRERRRDLVRAGLQEDQTCPVVYFVQGSEGGLIKIGHTNDIAKRLVSLQTGHPTLLTLLATEQGGPELERVLHTRFAHLRGRGEWFANAEELLTYIGNLTPDRNAVTNCDQSRDVVTGHAVSRDVTPCLAVPCLTVPSRAVLEKIPASPRKSRAHQLASDWVPERNVANHEAEQKAVARGIDLHAELAKLRDWAKGNAAKKTDWDAVWRNWTRNAKVGGGGYVQKPTTLELQLERIAMLEREEALAKAGGS